MSKPLFHKTSIMVNGHSVPVKVYREKRRSIRFSIGKKAAILRMPSHLSDELQQKEWERFSGWLKKTMLAKPGSEKVFGKTYTDGDLLTVGKRQYQLKITSTSNKNHSGVIENGTTIHLRLSENSSEEQIKKATQHLLSRLVAQDFKPQIVRRVAELNHLYFQKTVNSVNLKYNRSNWGSCSTKSNVNLSTCLLFAPDDVIDYVIIHELAHLIEMNHSPRFWALVKEAMPDYPEKEKWLKENWQNCVF